MTSALLPLTQQPKRVAQFGHYERGRIYPAVLKLRGAGFSVYRQGATQHRVGGGFGKFIILDDYQLRALAGSVE